MGESRRALRSRLKGRRGEHVSTHADTLEAFAQRRTYDAVDNGRDKWMVQAVGRWVATTLTDALKRAPAGDVLDVGCGEQPFRDQIEASGRKYVGLDAVQN